MTNAPVILGKLILWISVLLLLCGLITRHTCSENCLYSVSTQGSTTTTDPDPNPPNPPQQQKQKGQSVHHHLINKFHTILKEQQDKGFGSILECVAQWRSEGNEIAVKGEVITGNATNVASVTKQVAKMVCRSALTHDNLFAYILCLVYRHLFGGKTSFWLPSYHLSQLLERLILTLSKICSLVAFVLFSPALVLEYVGEGMSCAFHHQQKGFWPVVPASKLLTLGGCVASCSYTSHKYCFL